MDDDFVAGLDVRHGVADGLDDSGGIASTEVEALLIAGFAYLPVHANDVDRDAEGSPYVVVVDSGRHDVHKHVVRAEHWDRDDLALEGIDRLTEA